uniref:Uncharacterized protein n=1 Tax=Patiria miniata TaxID=46514 RepID=A0A914BFB4_PATMI
MAGENDEDATVDKSLVVNVLHSLTKEVARLLESARKQAKDSLQDFASSNVNALGASIGLYSEAFLRLGVITRKALDEVLGRFYRYQEIQSAVEELDDLESDWNAFLKDTESQLSKGEAQSSLSIGSPGPCDIELKDARTGRPSTIGSYLCKGNVIVVLLRHFACLPCRDHVAQLQQRAEDIARWGGHILVVSFGSREGALQWLGITGCPFDMVVDEDRKVYSSMGLGRSISKVWHISTITYYAEMKASGRTLPSKLENIEDDPTQMGGDLVVDRHGNTAFIHCSKTPPDRPAVDDLIKVLKDLRKDEEKSVRQDLEDDGPPRKIFKS